MLLYRGIRNVVRKQLSIFLNWNLEFGGSSAIVGGPARTVVVM